MSTGKGLDATQSFFQPGRMRAFERSARIGVAAEANFEDLRRSLLDVSGGQIDLNQTLQNDQTDLRQFFNRLAYTSDRYNKAVRQTFNSPHSTPFVFSFQNLGVGFPGPAKFYALDNHTSLKQKIWQRFVLPVPPAEYKIDVPNNPQTISTISGLQYTHAGNVEFDEISWEGFLPYLSFGEGQLQGSADSRRNINPYPQYIPDYIGNGAGQYKYRTPSRWVRELVTAMRANQPLRFTIHTANEMSNRSMTIDDETIILAPIAVTVSAFSWGMGGIGGNRKDVSYNITLKRWRRQQICVNNFVQTKKTQANGKTNGAGTKNG